MSYQLKIDIQSYWHPGTGSGRGADVDAIVYRDAEGLPRLPGKSLKGVLRNAVSRWEHFTQSASETSLADQLFGAGADDGDTWFGLIRVSDAVLADDVCHYLKQDQSLTTGLYRTMHSTAIDHGTGVATNKSLRGIEVVIPLTLYATLNEVPSAKFKIPNWHKLLEPALPLIQAVGAHRSRGLGRAVVSLEEVK